MDKPPYEIPPLAEIKAMAKTSGIKAVSTFSGCGGATLGLNWAGIEVVWASEFIEAAAETYRANHPTAILSTADIREVTGQMILADIGLAVGELEVLEGSPPCASFSSSGKREAGWGEERKYSDTTQRVDDLFFEYARLVGELHPKVFIAENVEGLAAGVARGYLKEIVDRLKAHGYRVGIWRLDARWMGVPQTRGRIVIHGVRSDIPGDLTKPTPLPYMYNWNDAMAKPLPETTDPEEIGVAPKPGGKVARVLARMKPGEDGQAVLGKGQYFNHTRQDPLQPSPCIMQGTHYRSPPVGNRYLTIPELRRICGFPDDFILTGKYEQRWERLGRAVAPPMYRDVGRSIVELLA